MTSRNKPTFFSANCAFPVEQQDSLTGVHFDQLSPRSSSFITVHLVCSIRSYEKQVQMFKYKKTKKTKNKLYTLLGTW